MKHLEIVLPFGIARERPPENVDLKTMEIEQTKKAVSRQMGAFNIFPKLEEKERTEKWAPRLKQVKKTSDREEFKPTTFNLRHEPTYRKEMFFQQDLMARPISEDLNKRNGFTYRLDKNKNVVVRKHLALVDERKFMELLTEFIQECNRVLFTHCETR